MGGKVEILMQISRQPKSWIFASRKPKRVHRPCLQSHITVKIHSFLLIKSNNDKILSYFSLACQMMLFYALFSLLLIPRQTLAYSTFSSSAVETIY